MSTPAAASEEDPLLPKTRRRQSRMVFATSVVEPKLEMTVETLFESPDEDHVHSAMTFTRRVFALLVLQYISILLIASPFALIESFQSIVHPYHNVIEIIAVVGIICSLVLAVLKGTTYPYARVALVLLTVFVALELGLSFTKSWGKYGIIAVGQATTSFAVILAVLQFDTKSLQWLTYPAAGVVSLLISCLWMVVLWEGGLTILISACIGLGGWVFACMNLYCCNHIQSQVGPDEFILATLFILVPEALVFLNASKRKPENESEGGVV